MDRIITWATLAFILVFAVVLSWGVVDAVMRGEIRTVVKTGEGTLYVLSQNPVGFWAAVVPHLFLAGIAWALAYWFWSKELRNAKKG